MAGLSFSFEEGYIVIVAMDDESGEQTSIAIPVEIWLAIVPIVADMIKKGTN